MDKECGLISSSLLAEQPEDQSPSPAWSEHARRPGRSAGGKPGDGERWRLDELSRCVASMAARFRKHWR